LKLNTHKIISKGEGLTHLAYLLGVGILGHGLYTWLALAAATMVGLAMLTHTEA
jgi:hypothetical protein